MYPVPVGTPEKKWKPLASVCEWILVPPPMSIQMGAVAGFGDLPDLVLAALYARNHGVLVCNAFNRLEEIADRIEFEAAQSKSFASGIAELGARLGTLRRDLCRAKASVPAPDEATVAQLWERARQEAEP